MNGTVNEPPKTEHTEIPVSPVAPFLQPGDWACFGITSLIMLAVYLFTMNPSIDLGFSGIFTAGSMYLGVPHVPGFPLWTVYSYFFTLLPISNAAWRVNAAAAVASALVCGLTALLTSRTVGAMLRDLTAYRQLEPEQEKKLRLVCGCVAGLLLGFDGAFWEPAVVGGPWNFSILLFAVTLAALMRWQHTPRQYHWFYGASFLYGLTLTNSQAFVPAGLGIMCSIICAHPRLGRDVLVLMTALVMILLLGERFGFLTGIIDNLIVVFLIIGGGALMTVIALVFITRTCFTNWRVVVTGAFVFVAGLLPYLLVPIFSMANPPMNWGYPRTVDGFFHTLSRGQYERMHPGGGLEQLGENLVCYFINTDTSFGAFYLCVALIPFFFLRRFQKPQRRWLGGVLGVLMSLSLFMAYLLNPLFDRTSMGMHAHFFAPSHLIFSILAGCGLAIAGLFLNGSRITVAGTDGETPPALAGEDARVT